MDHARPFDVFVSYSTKDKPFADAAVAYLEQQRLRCWVAPRDITAGAEWGEAIIAGIDASRTMLLIFSAHANESGQVRREVERAISKGLPVIPFRVAEVAPTGAMEYALGNTHWLDGFTPPVERHLDALAGAVRALLGKVEPQASGSAAAARPPARKRWPLLAGLAVTVALLGLLAAWAGGVFGRGKDDGAERRAEATTPTAAPAPDTAKPSLIAAKPNPDAANWVRLFNGKDLTGWEQLGNPNAIWGIKNGAIVGEWPKDADGTGGSYLTPVGVKYRHFRLRFQATKSEVWNSRVYIGAGPLGRPIYRVMLGSPDNKEGEETGRLGARGVDQPLKVSANRIPQRPWNNYDVAVQGNRITVEVNGVLTADWTDEQMPKYPLAVRLSCAGGDRISFRNIEIQERPAPK